MRVVRQACRCPRAESPLLERRIAELEAMAHAEAGETFCLSSPQEVGDAPCRSHARPMPAVHFLSAVHIAWWPLLPCLLCTSCACAPSSPALVHCPVRRQVSRILFEKLKLPPPPCAKELKSGSYSTGQEVGPGRDARQAVLVMPVEPGAHVQHSMIGPGSGKGLTLLEQSTCSIPSHQPRPPPPPQVLLELAEHPMARLILEHRKLNTLLTR